MRQSRKRYGPRVGATIFGRLGRSRAGSMTGEARSSVAGLAEADAPSRAPDRFDRRRADIVSAAIPILNSLGVKGMRLTEVAERIGLRSTGVTYYFPRKEELAVACFESGLAVFHDLLNAAEREPDIHGRVRRLVTDFLERDSAVRRGEATPLASFGSMHALETPHLERVRDGYRAMFRRVRALFEGAELAGLRKIERSMRALALLEQLYWANAWLGDYDTDDVPRIADRMNDIIANGIAGADAPFEPADLGLDAQAAAEPGKESFLLAATRQINAHGYRGASVDRISASLNVTKGAFYHYNDAKDDLVAACFKRSFRIMRDAQRLARGEGKSEWVRLATAVASLIRFQLSAQGPLLRTSVLSSMPQEHQLEFLNLSYRSGRKFAAMVSDAISEGTARPVDPVIASHLLSAAINAASDLRQWQDVEQEMDPLTYARPLLTGLLRP